MKALIPYKDFKNKRDLLNTTFIDSFQLRFMEAIHHFIYKRAIHIKPYTWQSYPRSLLSASCQNGSSVREEDASTLSFVPAPLHNSCDRCDESKRLGLCWA